MLWKEYSDSVLRDDPPHKSIMTSRSREAGPGGLLPLVGSFRVAFRTLASDFQAYPRKQAMRANGASDKFGTWKFGNNTPKT